MMSKLKFINVLSGTIINLFCLVEVGAKVLS